MMAMVTMMMMAWQNILAGPLKSGSWTNRSGLSPAFIHPFEAWLELLLMGAAVGPRTRSLTGLLAHSHKQSWKSYHDCSLGKAENGADINDGREGRRRRRSIDESTN